MLSSLWKLISEFLWWRYEEGSDDKATINYELALKNKQLVEDWAIL
jgi:hypothetical protein